MSKCKGKIEYFISSSSLSSPEQKEQEARTCKEKKEYLQNQVEPMRIMVDERSFIYHEQHARVVSMCSDMNIAVPALWQEETGTNDESALDGSAQSTGWLGGTCWDRPRQ